MFDTSALCCTDWTFTVSQHLLMCIITTTQVTEYQESTKHVVIIYGMCKPRWWRGAAIYTRMAALGLLSAALIPHVEIDSHQSSGVVYRVWSVFVRSHICSRSFFKHSTALVGTIWCQ